MTTKAIGMRTPEERARETIDVRLAKSGWIVQSRDQVNLSAGPGIAIREDLLTRFCHAHAALPVLIDKELIYCPPN